MGHMAAPELTLAGRGEPAPRDTWWHPSYPEPRGRSRCHGTHGGTRAAPSWEAGADATGRVMAPELPQAGR
jgi:hypothetical protein